MEFIKALLQQIFGKEQCGGITFAVVISLSSATHCSQIKRFSSCGGDETTIDFKPYLPLEEALLHARKYTEKGVFTHS